MIPAGKKYISFSHRRETEFPFAVSGLFLPKYSER
jgi:hypothetical protein